MKGLRKLSIDRVIPSPKSATSLPSLWDIMQEQKGLLGDMVLTHPGAQRLL